jgi:hypothetical protein
MATSTEQYLTVVAAFRNIESLTVLTVAGADREVAAVALDVDFSDEVGISGAWEGGDSTVWAIEEVPGGVLAFEPTGYGDPSLASLKALSEGGRAAAVVRSNVQARLRFGCSRDGQLLFDDGDFSYRPDGVGVPHDLLSLFDQVLRGREIEGYTENGRDGLSVGLAMAEVVTGIQLSVEQVRTIEHLRYYRAPTLVYMRDD